MYLIFQHFKTNSLRYIFSLLTIFFKSIFISLYMYLCMYLTTTNYIINCIDSKFSNHFHSLLYELEANLKVRWCRMYRVSSKPWKGNTFLHCRRIEVILSQVTIKEANNAKTLLFSSVRTNSSLHGRFSNDFHWGIRLRIS